MKPPSVNSAKRELKEEAGIAASRWTEIMRTHLSNSVTDEVGLIYLAQDLKKGNRSPEASESDMKVWKLPFTEALEMVLSGKITDALSVIGILKVARMFNL